jgi:DNA-binding MarR family transcriptional regulator
MDMRDLPILVPALERTTHAIAQWIDRAFGDVGLTQGEAHILATLAQHAPCTINDLHHRFGHKRSTLTSLLDRLERKGWIVRLPHPVSRRMVQVALTESGRQIGAQVTAALLALEQRVLARLAGEEAAAFLRALHVLQEETTHEQQHR